MVASCSRVISLYQKRHSVGDPRIYEHVYPHDHHLAYIAVARTILLPMSGCVGVIYIVNHSVVNNAYVSDLIMKYKSKSPMATNYGMIRRIEYTTQSQ